MLNRRDPISVKPSHAFMCNSLRFVYILRIKVCFGVFDDEHFDLIQCLLILVTSNGLQLFSLI